MPGSVAKPVLVAIATGSLLLAGCGGGDDGTIPKNDAETMLAQLEGVDSNVQTGNCDTALAQAEGFSSTVADLPNDVDPEVKQGLEDAADNLVALAGDETQCTPEGTTGQTGVETAPTTTEAVETTATTTTTEEPTTTEETTDPEPEPTEETTTLEPPTGQGNQDGGGGGQPSDGGIGPTGGIGGGGN